MKKSILVLVLGCLLASRALAQIPAPKDLPTVSQVLQRNVDSAEQALLAATEAMPEAKYSFAPTNGEFKGVRTFAQMARHVAVVNFMNAAVLNGGKLTIEIGGHENGADSIKTKAQIVKFLKDSFADLHKATDALEENNLMNPTTDPWSGKQVPRLMIVTTGISHPWEMYGQMVIYLRINGIDPYKNH